MTNDILHDIREGFKDTDEIVACLDCGYMWIEGRRDPIDCPSCHSQELVYSAEELEQKIQQIQQQQNLSLFED